MTRHVDRPGIVLANAKHLESNAGANAPGATFRHEITPAGESGFSEFDESLFTLCGLKGADVVADATVLFNAIHPGDVANFEHALAPDDDDTGNRRFETGCWSMLPTASARKRASERSSRRCRSPLQYLACAMGIYIMRMICTALSWGCRKAIPSARH